MADRPEPPLSERRYTLMLVPERGHGPVRQITVSLGRIRLWVSIVALAVLTLVFVALVSDVSGGSVETTGRLVEENLVLKGRLRAIEATLEEVDS